MSDNAIFNTDTDAIPRLREKLAHLEARRNRIKAINAAIRKGPGWDTRIVPPLSDHEREHLVTLARITPWHDVAHKGFPAYELQNLGGNITRIRQRLAALGA